MRWLMSRMPTMKQWKLFLDDLRTPPNDGWEIARSYEEAINLISERGMPQRIAFDHDLGTGKTGMDFAKWLVESLLDGGLRLPEGFTFSVHSDHPNGADNIRGLMTGILREMAARTTAPDTESNVAGDPPNSERNARPRQHRRSQAGFPHCAPLPPS